nr:reverse transcriptase domain-containing protein [Tanacetum cinerariifolium]
MSTRSSTKILFPPLDNSELTIRRRPRVDLTLLNDFEMATNGSGDDVHPPEGGDLPFPDLRTMEELCQPTLNGQGGPIASIAIQAMNFGLKKDMIQQVQNSCQFYGLSGDDANKHLNKFLHVTQSIKVNGSRETINTVWKEPGHKSSACRKERGKQLMMESGKSESYEYEDEVEYAVEPCYDEDDESNEDNLVYGDSGQMLVIRKSLLLPKEEEKDEWLRSKQAGFL